MTLLAPPPSIVTDMTMTMPTPELSERDQQMAHQLVVAVLELSGQCDWSLAPAETCLPTAPELARHLNMKLDKLKKKLKWLLSAGVLESVSYAPKRYRLDVYRLRHRESDPEVAFLIHPDSSYSIPLLQAD